MIKQYKQPKNGEHPNPGIYSNVPNDHYHNSPNWNMLSAGGLKTLIKQSPLHFITAQNNTGKTEAMNFGSAFHSHILEPELEEIAIAPNIPKRSNADKAIHAEFNAMAEKNNKIVVKESEMETIFAMEESLKNCHTAWSLIEGTDTELSVTWKHHTFGFDCKCRSDIFYPDFHEGMNIIGDLKTCQDASPESFGKTIINSLYHIQAYWYRLGVESMFDGNWEFVFIAIEKTAPYGVGVYTVPMNAFLIAKRDVEIACKVYNDCQNENHYPGYPDEFKTALIPAWAK